MASLPLLDPIGRFDTPGTAYDVAIAGNYAYVADRQAGLQVIDISDPSNPSFVSSSATDGEARGIAIAGNYAYVANFGDGLAIFDISDLNNLELVSTFNTNGQAWDVAIAGNYAYIADSYGGLQIIDVSQPRTPSLLGTYDTAGLAYGVAIVGSYAYVADGNDGLKVIDISDPSNPSLTGTYRDSDNPSLTGTYRTIDQARDVAIAGSYAYVAYGRSGLQIVDISDPANPAFVAAYDDVSDNAANALGVTLSGNYAYVANAYRDMQVIDISDPSNPSLVNTNNTTNENWSVAVAGEKIYAASGGNGLEVFECFLTGTLVATESGQQPVESLEIGDRIQTADGKFEPIKWIGTQTFNATQQPAHPFRTYPIRIQAGALGHNLPSRDLYTSPDHALLIDGLLINAGALTNGTTITQVPMAQFTYYHIELEHHALLLAEGTPAESYLPQHQARDSFDNGAEYDQLYPNHSILSLLPMNYPRVSSKRQLPRFVAKRLQQVAQSLESSGHTIALTA